MILSNYRYHKGTVNQIGNLYPNEYLKLIYEGTEDKIQL